MLNQKTIIQWIKDGKKDKSTHLIVVRDTFDNDYYPVFVKKEEDVKTKFNKYDGNNMQKVMEVYNLKMDIDKQLAEHRAFNL